MVSHTGKENSGKLALRSKRPRSPRSTIGSTLGTFGPLDHWTSGRRGTLDLDCDSGVSVPLKCSHPSWSTVIQSALCQRHPSRRVALSPRCHHCNHCSHPQPAPHAYCPGRQLQCLSRTASRNASYHTNAILAPRLSQLLQGSARKRCENGSRAKCKGQIGLKNEQWKSKVKGKDTDAPPVKNR